MANRLVLIVVPAVLASAEAFGGSLTVTLNNGSTDNVLVTVYDMNASPPLRMLSGEVINGNASVAVTLAGDMSGQGHLAWSATTVDQDMRECGHGDSTQLNDGDSVSVTADTDC